MDQGMMRAGGCFLSLFGHFDGLCSCISFSSLSLFNDEVF